MYLDIINKSDFIEKINEDVHIGSNRIWWRRTIKPIEYKKKETKTGIEERLWKYFQVNLSQIGGNFGKMEESINNLQTSFSLSNQEYFKGKDGAERIRACFRRAKPNHSYHECRNATLSEKENITNFL